MSTQPASPIVRTAAAGIITLAGIAGALTLPLPRAAGVVIACAGGACGAWLAMRARPAPPGPGEALRARVAQVAGAWAGVEAGAGDPSAAELLDAIERRLRGSVEREAEHRRRLLALFDAVDAPVVATDENGLVTLCNRAAELLVGAGAGTLLGRRVDEVFTQADLLSLHSAASGGREGRSAVRISRVDGVGVFEASAVPAGRAAPPGPAGSGASDNGTYPVVMTLRDVTELSRAVQVKSDFVANASHELRTPIAALRMAVETLQQQDPEDPAMRSRLVGVIESNTARLEEMVRDLLDLTRVESPEAPVRIGPAPASELARALAPLFEGICRDRRLTLRFELAPELERMRTDRELLTLILKNLIDNATKFAYEGTEVRVSGRVGDRPADEPAGARPAVFEVTDRGVGIPLGQQQRVFERYYQVDPARAGSSPRRGSGLGLAIVKHAVRALGGVVRVSSVWKSGTTMTIELPGAVPA